MDCGSAVYRATGQHQRGDNHPVYWADCVQRKLLLGWRRGAGPSPRTTPIACHPYLSSSTCQVGRNTQYVSDQVGRNTQYVSDQVVRNTQYVSDQVVRNTQYVSDQVGRNTQYVSDQVGRNTQYVSDQVGRNTQYV